MRVRFYLTAALALLLPTMGASAQEGDTNPPPPLAAGTVAPAIVTPSINGKGAISLRSLRGKVVLVDYWATWCIPCRLTTPTLEALSKQYGKSGLVVLGLNTDQANTYSHVKPFLKQYGITYPVARLTPGVLKSALAYHVQYLPSVYLIDRKGIVRWSQAGYAPQVEEELKLQVKSLLAK